MPDKLIYDRTAADVARVNELMRKVRAGSATDAEREEWLGGRMKGAYNAADLNRVGAAVSYLTDALRGLGYDVPTKPKTDWTITDIPRQAQMETYLENIRLLRDCLVYAAPPAPDPAERFAFEQANNIEEILSILERVLLDVQEGFRLRQAGTLFMIAGGVFHA